MAIVKKSVALSLKVTPVLHERVARLARRWDRSLNWTATKLIEEGLDRAEQRKNSSRRR